MSKEIHIELGEKERNSKDNIIKKYIELLYEILNKNTYKKNSIVIDFADEILTDGKKVEIFLKGSANDEVSQNIAVTCLYILYEFKGNFEFDFETNRHKITIFDTKGIKFYTTNEVCKNE